MKKWQKNVLSVLAVIFIVYLMIYIRVRTEAAREFKQAEKYYYYYHHPEEKRKDMLATLTKKRKKEKLQKGQEVASDIERFKREMTEYYYHHPEQLKPDLDFLLSGKYITQQEYNWLMEELKDIKEIIESDIKTAYYGYKTVIDIWLDPPGWPPSVLRNIKLARKTREILKKIEPEFSAWVNEGPSASPAAKKSK
jgi:hypothetical protein